eukprot:6175132-Pleurochrysis_carterae.AAC.1
MMTTYLLLFPRDSWLISKWREHYEHNILILTSISVSSAERMLPDVPVPLRYRYYVTCKATLLLAGGVIRHDFVISGIAQPIAAMAMKPRALLLLLFLLLATMLGSQQLLLLLNGTDHGRLRDWLVSRLGCPIEGHPQQSSAHRDYADSGRDDTGADEPGEPQERAQARKRRIAQLPRQCRVLDPEGILPAPPSTLVLTFGRCATSRLCSTQRHHARSRRVAQGPSH